jgi:hypothetical protein
MDTLTRSDRNDPMPLIDRLPPLNLSEFRSSKKICARCIGVIFAASVFAQDRPSLLFREDWQESPAALPVTQEHVTHPELTLHLHGQGQDGIKKSHHDKPLDDPYYIWSGTCEMGNWAVSLEPTSGPFDLTGQAKVKWRAKQSGFRVLRLIIQIASGDWLVADQGDDASHDWRIREFNIADLNWRKLNIDTMIEKNLVVTNPDLTRVTQIGFTDLMLGGQSQACSRLDWIEVYAQSLPQP